MRPAQYGWLALIGAGLAYDVELERRNLEGADLGLLSDVARTVVGWVFTILLLGHFGGLLGPLDPFRGIGRVAAWLARWSTPKDRVLP